jgi:release factor glutamine methyltransferase
MGPAEVVHRASAYLGRHGVESAAPTAELLLAGVLGTDRAGLYQRADPLTPEESKAFGRALCLRCSGTPVQHLTGEQGFRRLILRVRAGVFIPRPETETLVEVALETVAAVAEPAIVDVGTGSGAIALALADEHPRARIWATDRSPEAVALARENAGSLGLNITVAQGDLLGPVPGSLRGALDLIVSNPPYIPHGDYAALPPEVRADPIEALVGGIEGYGRLAGEAAAWLKGGGNLAVEIGEDLAPEVTRVLVAAGFEEPRVHRDLAGRNRVVAARWP